MFWSFILGKLMSDAHASLSLYYTMLVLMGVPWLAASARGLFAGFAWEHLIYLAVPVLVVHVMVIPGYIAHWDYQWAALLLHALVAVPIGAALYLTLLREWDALERKRGSRALLAVVWVGGAMALIVLAPGVQGVMVAGGIAIASVAGALCSHHEIA